MALNHISIAGRLTKDVDLRYTNSGKAVASFTLAVDRDFGDKATDFINCVAWEGTGKFVADYFSKGKMAIVAGRLQMREYEDKNGNKRTAAEVVCTNVYFGESKKNEQTAPKRDINELNKFSGTRFAELNDDDMDSLPF
jgi:single-strand DNA-binding protein